MLPKVSVIIPTYNRANLLPRAINSVLNQTFKDFELIIVDDGSTDNTRKVVKEFEEKDSRIKYIWQENFGGPAKPTNTGLKISKGKYIAFLDSDDEWMPEKLEKQLEVFQTSKKSPGFVSCNVLIVNKEKKATEIYNLHKHDDKTLLAKILTYKNIYIGFPMLIIKKEVLDNVGFLDENLKVATDYDFYIRIAEKYKFDFAPIPLVKVYIHRKNLCRSFYSYNKELIELLYIVNKHKDIFKRYPKIYSQKLKNIGIFYMFLDKRKKAQRFFLESLKIYPLNLKSCLNLFSSFFGKNIYLKLLNFKKKIPF